MMSCGRPWETTGPKIIMPSTNNYVYGPEAPFHKP